MPALLAAEPVFMVSIFKPLLMLVVVLAWARWASILDKDAGYFYLQRRMLNGLTLGAGALGLLLWLVIPWFWLGLLLFLMFTVGAGVAYVMIRNPKVPDNERWHLSTAGIQRILLQREQASAERDVALRFVGKSSESASHFKPVPLQEDPQYQAHISLDALFTTALQQRAEKIDIALSGNDLAVRLHVDGVPYRHDAMQPGEALAAIDYLKWQCGLDTDDRRRKQEGTTRIDLGELGQHNLEVETAGSTRGLTLKIDIDRRKQLNRPFEELGLLESQHDQLKPLLVENEGLVIVAAPPDHGRTTTLYALLQQHDPYLTDIHTLEQPIETDVEGVSQHAPGESGWSKSLNSLLLRDPAVVMVGQIADTETAKLAAKAATDHKRIYVGIRADDTFAALKAWAKTVGDLELVGQGTRAVICQRLVRKLCTVCRQAYQPDAAALKKLNLPADRIKELYKSSGRIPAPKDQTQPCPTCNGLGFHGRTAAFEVMVLDEQARQLLGKGNLNGLRSHVRKNKMLWLQEAALAKVVNGQTSISEVMRALGQAESSGKSGAGQTAATKGGAS